MNVAVYRCGRELKPLTLALVKYSRRVIPNVRCPEEVTGEVNFAEVVVHGRIPGMSAIFPILWKETRT
jgi:hypothetical protein